VQPTTSNQAAPGEVRRAIWVFTVLLVVILAISPSDLLSPTWWGHQAQAELGSLSAAGIAGAVLGVLLSRDIWNLRSSQNNLIQDLLLASAAIAVVAALIAVRELGWWVWSFASADALVAGLLGTMVFVTAYTERTRRVKVYTYARRFVFIPAPSDA
jgi:hypothetical protein